MRGNSQNGGQTTKSLLIKPQCSGVPIQQAVSLSSSFPRHCFLFALFQIGYRANLTTSHMILFRGVQYDIVHIDPFEGYKADLKLYCKRKNK